MPEKVDNGITCPKAPEKNHERRHFCAGVAGVRRNLGPDFEAVVMKEDEDEDPDRFCVFYMEA